MADAGWQLQAGLRDAGYTLCGHKLKYDETDVPTIIEHFNPGIVIVQDRREWEGHTAGQLQAPWRTQMRFERIEALKERDDIFKLTVVKDAQQRPGFHRQTAEDMGIHAWIIYYHPRIVRRLSPFVRPGDCIRTYHSVNTDDVPVYSPVRQDKAIVSGAVSSVYPLRKKAIKFMSSIPKLDYARHPGYGTHGCKTPRYLMLLSKYKVSIATASKYGFSLRKIIEATAVGCRVITDLPADDVLPGIDCNLVRVHPSISVDELKSIIDREISEYNPEFQEYMSLQARAGYDYRVLGARLNRIIDEHRAEYIRRGQV